MWEHMFADVAACCVCGHATTVQLLICWRHCGRQHSGLFGTLCILHACSVSFIVYNIYPKHFTYSIMSKFCSSHILGHTESIP
jgi:hypothetical protein